MNINQLEKLARNPFYKMNPEQLRELEEYREQQLLDEGEPKPKSNPKTKNRVIKHSNKFKKHDTRLEEEDEADTRTIS